MKQIETQQTILVGVADKPYFLSHQKMILVISGHKAKVYFYSLPI
jgi:hypothetical protein